MRRLFGLAILWLMVLNAYAQHPTHNATPAERATAYRIQAMPATGPIRIDGLLDEADWQRAMPVTGFWQKFPGDSTAAENQTEVRVLYDDEMLYVAARNHEPSPGEYVVQSLRRDFDRDLSDFFAIVLDPFNDQTNGFVFHTSPMGVQLEGLLNNGGNMSLDWDNRWYTETVRREGGWDVEMAIPYKSLRFKNGAGSWRVNFIRTSMRAKKEYSTWVPIPRTQSTLGLLFTGTLEFAEAAPARPRGNIAYIPYVLGNASRDYANAPARPQTGWEVGGDVKVAVGPSLNLDLTVNPDFAQAEVDRQQVNLTQFDLFFPERRQFFLENADLFANFGFSTIRPFFSRRIGLNSSILAGARLSGKIGRDWRIGLMSIQTEGRAATSLRAQNYTVAAMQRQFGTSNLGFIAVNRQAWDQPRSDEQGFLSQDYNRVLGVDYNLQNTDGEWRGKIFYHQAFAPKEVSSGRQPYAHAMFLRYNPRQFQVEWNHELVGRDYVADVGFVPRLSYRDPVSGTRERRGFFRIEPIAQYNFYTDDHPVLNQISPGFYVSQYHFLADGKRNEGQYRAYVDVIFQSSAVLGVFAQQRFVNQPFALNLGLESGRLVPAGSHQWYNGGVFYESDARKKLSMEAELVVGEFYGGRSHSISAAIAYRTQPWAIWRLNMEYNRIRLPEGNNDLLLLGPEAELSFTRSLFLTTVIQYNTADDAVAHTTRLQWRFRPMSDLFIVYSDLHNDTFQAQQQGLLVKLVWWLQS